jgi:hypothetical protein
MIPGMIPPRPPGFEKGGIVREDRVKYTALSWHEF